ncbi:membrane-associated phospholipid phosphatase [Lewinella aquimaris]|uniref:Membrane-associated phospholipid phosphatase n=1 Tax=Neolewinella aquimaris TaxID=1835722 RepID=A0A840EBW6_9BACT|nr:phosphatase PAP2 family protein [Neolewinella aquimaris]MBB4080947.1 membrane-associated phospholipid phosphatase [Neolewinella aquimaris]
MARYFFLFIALFLLSLTAFAQPSSGGDEPTEKIYRVKPLPELGAAAVGLGVTIYAFQKINGKDRFDANALDRGDVPGYDRWIFPDNTNRISGASGASDIGFYAGIGLPFALFLHPTIRKDWFDITTMYVQAQALNGLLYAATPIGPSVIDRARPSAYYPDSFDDGSAPGKDLNGFFSGHVSTTATGTFFVAKVLSDYHPHWTGGQRALLYGAASIPPLYVAVQRVRALRHFPSDTLVGFGIGAAVGVLTPHIHKRWQEKHRSSLGLSGGFTGDAGVAGVTLTF